MANFREFQAAAERMGGFDYGALRPLTVNLDHVLHFEPAARGGFVRATLSTGKVLELSVPDVPAFLASPGGGPGRA